MDHFSRLKSQIKLYLLSCLLFVGVTLVGSWWVLTVMMEHAHSMVGIILLFEAIVLAFFVASPASEKVLEPFKYLQQAILHVSPGNGGATPPNLKEAKLGRELVTSLALQVYQLASSSDKSGMLNSTSADLRARSIASNLPLPLIVLDKSQNIIFTNDAANRYLGKQGNDIVGKNFYSSLDLSFTSKDTLDKWLETVKAHTLTASKSWDHVRLKMPDRPAPLQFDMAAHYSKDSPSGVETIITLFDRSADYASSDNDVSFVALAVHELRSPLTLLRGYIEVFEEELAGKLTPELDGFMRKMRVSSQQLTAFINNILNVARIESNQLTLQLHEENLNDIVKAVAADFSLRASLGQKSIELQLGEKLPSVAADRVSIFEVVSNLVDNALKYSPAGQKVIIKTSIGDGDMVEATVQDFGVGIATNIVPHLFEKFYRSFHTEQHAVGTGLGLYLSKALISSHGGNIWVRSKEGEGTTIGFTLKPYTSLAAELKNNNNEITRSAHGWIKNHSLFRR